MSVTDLLSSAIKCLQLQGASPPWPPDQGLCPWTPLGAPPPDPHIRSRSRARHILSVPVLFLTENEPCLVWGLAATRRSICIHQMNRVNSRNDFGSWWQHHKHSHGYYYYYYYGEMSWPWLYSELKFETEKISASYIDAWFLTSSLW